ncbi:MAG TPA: methyltransferase domain-containing protein [Bacteroidota bacterium]|nr:methyltransferase domain-containing protein [Bacteroidota bacterium]
MNDVNTPHFWEELYRSGQTGWDMGRPAPAFVALLESGRFKPGTTLVLGCGKGYDAVLFARYGFDVTAIDFSPTAIECARDLARKEGVHLHLVQEDLFDYSLGVIEEFDYIVEYVTYCAIDPSRRPEFAAAVASMLKRNGELFALFFPLDNHEGGPPFAVSMDEVVRLFGRKLDLVSVEAPPESVPSRKGKELITIWRKP